MGKTPPPKVYSAVTVGERGQIVIPMEVRKLFSIKAGDKLIVYANEGAHIGLVPATQFSAFLSQATRLMAKINPKS